MNSRERFLAVMNFEETDRVPLWEFGYWVGAIRRWYREGLPKKAGVPDAMADGAGIRGEGNYWTTGRPRDYDIHAYLGLDTGIRRIPLENFLCPAFPEEILEDHGSWILLRDEFGIIRKEAKDRSSVPQSLSWPVSNRDDWERIKAERLRPTLEGRLPANWPEQRAEMKERDYPLLIGGAFGGFFGTLTNLVGSENLLVGYYDDPKLIKDITNYLADFWIAIYGRVLDQVDADMALIWEDMSYKTGSMISPGLFREFMMPAYKKLTSFLKERGVEIVFVDTDGNCWELIPLFLEGGATGMFPFECQAGMDVVEVRKAFPRLQIIGGLDKTKFAAGRDAIDAELEAKVSFMLRHGGYIPMADHLVPPDVSWENFLYYRRRLEAMVYEAARTGEAAPR